MFSFGCLLTSVTGEEIAHLPLQEWVDCGTMEALGVKFLDAGLIFG